MILLTNQDEVREDSRESNTGIDKTIKNLLASVHCLKLYSQNRFYKKFMFRKVK